MTKITDERLAEMVGAGVPCVPAQPGEIAAVVQELRRHRASQQDSRCDYCREHGFQYPNLCEDCRVLKETSNDHE